MKITRGKQVSLSRFLELTLEDPHHCVAFVQNSDTESIMNPTLYFGNNGVKLAPYQKNPDWTLVLYRLDNFFRWPQLFLKKPFRQWMNHSLKTLAILSSNSTCAEVEWIDEDFHRVLESMIRQGAVFNVHRASDGARYDFELEWNQARQKWQAVDPFEKKQTMSQRMPHFV